MTKCLVSHQVKPYCQKTGGFLCPLPNFEWKWEHITMNFLFGLSRTPNDYNGIWVIVDRFTKMTRFIPIKQTFPLDKLALLSIDKIISQFGYLLFIVLDRDPRFTSKFWLNLQEVLGTRLHFSAVFHPQTDGQSERIIQILEVMLRTCIL